MTHTLRYARTDPTGNRTLLVQTPVPAAHQPAAAAQLMAREPDAEQVGFLSPGMDGAGDISLRMAGGEFCGNAAMSAAVLCAAETGLADGSVSVAVSGAETPVDVLVTALPDGSWRGAVAMPQPRSIREERLSDAGDAVPLVRFDGIAHAILETAPERARAEALAPVWCRSLGADALGLMFLDRERETLTPLVYVPAAKTLCWENSCASGTTAVGAYLAQTDGTPLRLALRQPGGILEIDADAQAGLRLIGTVKLLSFASASVEW